MGVVTINALAFFNSCMKESLGHTCLFLVMAFIAKFVSLSLEQQFWDLTVP